MLRLNDICVGYYKNIEYFITFDKPEGFKEIKGAFTAPSGSVWMYNGYGIFEKNEHGVRKRLQILFVEDEEKFKKSKFYKNLKFYSDATPLTYAMGLIPKQA